MLPNHIRRALVYGYCLPSVCPGHDNLALMTKHRCLNCLSPHPYLRHCGHGDLLNASFSLTLCETRVPFKCVWKSSYKSHMPQKIFPATSGDSSLLGQAPCSLFPPGGFFYSHREPSTGEVEEISGCIFSVTVERRLTYLTLLSLCPVIWLLHVFTTPPPATSLCKLPSPTNQWG